MPNLRILGVSLNPGPFNIKEHVLITMMATVGYQAAYAVSPLSNPLYVFLTYFRTPRQD